MLRRSAKAAASSYFLEKEIAISSWELQSNSYGHVTFRRDLGDRFFAYVVYDKEEDREPFSYHWSVQDGSCGRVLEQGWVDGEEGMAAAKAAADEAAAQLRPAS